MHEEHASCARKECVSHLQGPALTPFSFPCSEIVGLTQDDEEKRKKKIVKEATRKKWVKKFPWIEWTGCMVLNQLHKKVCQIEIGRLEDGIDDGEPEFDFAFCADDGSDDDDGDDDALWLEDEEGSDEVEDESIFALDPDSVAVCHDELWYQLKHGLQV